MSLTNEIKFKKIGNEVNQTLPGQDCNELKDCEHVPYGVWRIYLQFLEALLPKVEGIRAALHAPFTPAEVQQSQFLIQDQKGKGFLNRKKENRRIPLTEPHSKVLLIMRSEKAKLDYLQAFKDSMSKANFGVVKSRLKNLYNRYDNPHVTVYSEYFQAKSNQHFLSKLKSEQIWKKNIISET